ncbi:hypothetical protein [Mucilaginibacter terrae]|uniref:DUF3352 domain-containing protein n=1 Tax=Mucilaginibacter terrae TaxID=1955052 RepID=A0ABU3H0Q0_9SPHI|nr:hypothetical protein [Mucilaginibacter terrae]MDT3405582.1 hypothetical protein [Mucilaginibacter terrae]
MKRLIIITILLVAATVVVTVKYFDNLNLAGPRTAQVINTIPSSAALVFEFNNDASFYDIYNNSQLFTSIIGQQKMNELHSIRSLILENVSTQAVFNAQDIFFSIHPQANDTLEYLVTIPATGALQPEALARLKLQSIKIAGKTGYIIRTDSLQKNFYIAPKDGNIWAGSFSKPLLEESLNYKTSDKDNFALLSDQQHSNTLGNLYINYQQSGKLLNQFYKKGQADIFKGLQMLPATTALSLNYKSDALIFNGFTTFKQTAAMSYLDLFRQMAPVELSLQEIFPITTAYSSSYGFNDVARFKTLLAKWEQKTGLEKDRSALFKKIKSETGVQFDTEFNKLLDNEFAIITTRFEEKLAIIKLKNGAGLKPFCYNISNMITDDCGQFNYNQIPLFLLGDVMSLFRKPYFIILDNYLVLANSQREINNYKQNYFNNQYLSKGTEFIEFNNLVAERCNINYFIHFKNAGNAFKRLLKPYYNEVYQQEPGFKNYYAAAYQLSGSENQFYTNLCIKLLKPDSTTTNGN